MRQAEKNPQKEPAASPPNPERRKFLRNVLLAGALAPLACSKEPSETSRPITLIQNRPFRVGEISLALTSCREGGEFPSVSINIYKKGAPGADHSVSMLVPASFRFQAGGFEYELQAESVSFGTPNSMSGSLVRKGLAPQGGAESGAKGADLFTMGAALGLVSAILFAIFERKTNAPDEGIVLPPKRRP